MDYYADVSGKMWKVERVLSAYFGMLAILTEFSM